MYGQTGTLSALIKTHLTEMPNSAKLDLFGDGREKDWRVLAQNKAAWRKFVRGVKVPK